MTDEKIPQPVVTEDEPPAVPPFPPQPKALTITIDAGTTALLLDGLAQLPLARSLNTFERLRAEYRRAFEGVSA